MTFRYSTGLKHLLVLEGGGTPLAVQIETWHRSVAVRGGRSSSSSSSSGGERWGGGKIFAIVGDAAVVGG